MIFWLRFTRPVLFLRELRFSNNAINKSSSLRTASSFWYRYQNSRLMKVNAGLVMWREFQLKVGAKGSSSEALCYD